MLPRPKFLWTIRALLAAAAACTLWQQPVFAQDFGGGAKVLVMTGRVSVLRDNNEWALNPGNIVKPQQVVMTGPDGYAKFQLSDGSTFEVFQSAKVVFQPSWGLTNVLDVLLGRVKVFIDHSRGPNYKNVTTQTAVISVRGTMFDVQVNEEDTTFVSVDDGIVLVRHRLFGNEKELRAGDSIQVVPNQPLAKNVDKGNAARVALRAASQAVYDALYRRSAGGTSVPGSPAPGGGNNGDKGNTEGGNTPSGTSGAPPTPPPPPPPPHESPN
jgi:hypothetical protein